MAEVKKEVGVKMWVRGAPVIIRSTVRSKFDANDNLIITFKIGQQEDEVKLEFDKRFYLDIQK